MQVQGPESSRTTQNTLSPDAGIPLNQVQQRGSESQDRDKQDNDYITYCATVKEENRYPCIIHEVYLLLRTKELKRYEILPCEFFLRPVWTHSTIETPYSTTTTCPNMNEQRRGSYGDYQIKFKKLEKV